jgi:hypothetical protein
MARGHFGGYENEKSWIIPAAIPLLNINQLIYKGEYHDKVD